MCDTLMVLGTTSGCGKSFVATALCRWFSRQGVRVAPFKSQNMSNHARVVKGLVEGSSGEIGSAQYFQALAAEVVPDVRMNPILLKPQVGGCEVVVLGAVTEELRSVPWKLWNDMLWPHAQRALWSLRADHELVVIEGMGSPAEINLSDIANMKTADEANSRCLLVVDIDRGGAFAHLLGTFLLLSVAERARICGFVINRFRGDAELLISGTEVLRERTGIPTVAVLPFVSDGIPAEDSLFVDKPARSLRSSVRVTIVAYPHMSNADEFDPLLKCEDLDVVWGHTPNELEGSNIVILPGSKDTTSDLKWITENGIAARVSSKVDVQGVKIFGICGGFQMLGNSIEESDESHPGLSILPLTTKMKDQKLLRQVTVTLRDTQLPLHGYEIHRGDTERIGQLEPFLFELDETPVGWRHANVFGTYVHGLFENDEFRRDFVGLTSKPQANVFDTLADLVDLHFDKDFLGTFLPT